MKTAVEWLLKQYVELGTLSKSIVEQAKAIEKEQIMAAWLMDGYTDISNDEWKKEFEEYYNDKYKSE